MFKKVLLLAVLFSSTSYAASDYTYSLGVSYGLNPKAAHTDMDLAKTGFSSVEVEADGGFTIEAEIRKMKKQSWGYTAGVVYGLKQDVSKASVKTSTGNSSNNFASPKPTLQTTFITLNAVYRWNEFYIPFGINYLLYDYKAASGQPTIDSSGGLGGQFALGYQFGDHFALEYGAKASYVKMKDTTTDYGTGIFSSAYLTAKYIF